MIFVIRGGRKASLSPLNQALLPIVLALFLCLPALTAFAHPPLAGYNPARLPHAESGPFLDSSAFAADTALPVLGIIDDSWRGSFSALEQSRADLYWKTAGGVVISGWRVAAFNRGELFIDSNRDAIAFVYAVKKKRELDTSRTYDAEMEAHGFIANGVELSHGRDLDRLVPGLSAGGTLRYLNGRYLQDGRLTGKVVPLGPKSYDFDLYLDYAYSRNLLYHREDEETGPGHGFSADLGLSYRYGAWHGEALLRDLWGAIYWESAPFTTANAVTPGAPTTTNGYQEFTPSIMGYEANKRHRQKIPVKTDLSLGYDHPPLSASATVILIEGRPGPLTWFEGAYHLDRDLGIFLGYNLEYAALSCGVAVKGVSFGITLADLPLKDSRTLGFQLAYLYAW